LPRQLLLASGASAARALGRRLSALARWECACRQSAPGRKFVCIMARIFGHISVRGSPRRRSSDSMPSSSQRGAWVHPRSRLYAGKSGAAVGNAIGHERVQNARPPA
jgi:hypothetical protein